VVVWFVERRKCHFKMREAISKPIELEDIPYTVCVILTYIRIVEKSSFNVGGLLEKISTFFTKRP